MLAKMMYCMQRSKQNHPGCEELSCSSNDSVSDNLLGDLKKEVTVRIRLFPRESQPSSSTRWWLVTLKTRSLFRRKKHDVQITEYVGTKTFATNEAKFAFEKDNIEIRGELDDDSVTGAYFLLQLRRPQRDEGTGVSDEVTYEGTLARCKDWCTDNACWEVTHDAIVFRDQTGE